jgi:hypothetical protein
MYGEQNMQGDQGESPILDVGSLVSIASIIVRSLLLPSILGLHFLISHGIEESTPC